MPMMAFIGVRISWLILARNSVFERLACSALLGLAQAVRDPALPDHDGAGADEEERGQEPDPALGLHHAALEIGLPAHRFQLLLQLGGELVHAGP